MRAVSQQSEEPIYCECLVLHIQQSGPDLHFWRLSVFNFHSSIPRPHIDIQPFSVYWCRKEERKLRQVTDFFTQRMLRKLVIFSVDKLSPPSSERTSSVHGVWEGGVIFIHRAKLWGSFIVAENWEWCIFEVFLICNTEELLICAFDEIVFLIRGAL